MFGHSHGGHSHVDISESKEKKDQFNCERVEILEINNKDDFAQQLFPKIIDNEQDNKVLSLRMITLSKNELTNGIDKGEVLKPNKVQVENKVLKDSSEQKLVKETQIVLHPVVNQNAQHASTEKNPIVSNEKDPKTSETKKSKCVVAPYVMLTAIGIHCIFAGLALGLEDEKSGFMGLLLAILLHKWAESMTMGIS